MIRHVAYCDKCGSEIKDLECNYNPEVLRFSIDRTSDGDEYTNTELCSTCMINFMHFLFKKFNERFPGQLLQEFLKNK